MAVWRDSSIETAFLLGSLRRLLRPTEAAALSPIHSLAYFAPVIEEVLHNPVPDTYIEYLRRKTQPFAGKKVAAQESRPASVQKKEDSDDR
jgi:hypothetical protein